jgi:hypothetical protein
MQVGSGFSNSVFLAHVGPVFPCEEDTPSEAKKPELMGYFPSVFLEGVCFFTCLDKA